MDEKKFYGPNEVSGVVIMDEKTPSGKDIVKVLFVSPTMKPEVVPLVAFERVVSKEPKDLNWLREKRYEALLNEVWQALGNAPFNPDTASPTPA